MFILKLMGGAALEGPEGPLAGRPVQKRRLALLALLAMSRTGRLSRDKLISYLWPDREPEAARHLLSDAVYVLNRALGSDTLVATGDELRLNSERLSCDACLFEAAAGEDADRAARLYTGPFLDGFFLDGSEEFERWSTRERERLSGLLTSVLERQADACEAAGDHRKAIEVWRRIAAEDPYNSRLALRLARALERSGDPGGALQAAQAHAAFLRQDLGLHPAADLRDLIASLQAAPAAAPAPAVPPQPAATNVPERPAPSDDTPAPAPVSPPAGVVTPAPAPRPIWRWLIVPLTAVLIVLAWLASGTDRPAAGAVQSLAVMPFDDLGETRSPYVGEAIADELTTLLGRATGLRVAARTSAFALKGRHMDARGIGRALGVDGLLEGSVRLAEDRARVAVRLVNTRNGYQVWAETWDRPAADLPSLQEEIAGAVLAALDVEGPAPRGRTHPRRNIPAAAYHLYLEGRYLWHQRTRESLQRAAAAFEQAIELAPEYAEAFSGLADASAVMGFYDYLPPGEAFPRAREAAQRALELDPDLAQAHASLGYVALYYDWDWPRAEAALERAVALNPSYSTGHQWYGNYLAARGRFDAAREAMRRAQAVDPLSLIASSAAGWVHFYSRDFDAAVEQCRRALALNPGFGLAHLWAGWAHDAAGRYADAVTHLTEAVRLTDEGAVALASLSRAQALAGDTASARATLARLRKLHAGYLPAYELAKVHLALNDRDEAFAWLDRALAERSHSMVFLGVDPHLDPMREDPRFARLAAAITPLSASR